MDDLAIAVGGLRAMLFTCAFISAVIFVQEIGATWTIICSLVRGRLRSNQIVGIAAFGWFVLALSCMMFTGYWLYAAIFLGVNPMGATRGPAAMMSAVGMWGMSLGFYLPVLAMMAYREKLWLGLLLGFFACGVGLFFVELSYHMPLHNVMRLNLITQH